MINFNKAEFLSSFADIDKRPLDNKTEIVFAGRSNVGKSSALNKILNRKSLARVSSVPGKTININYYKVDNIYFVDLPGYGYAKSSHAEKERFSKLVDSFFRTEHQKRLLIILVDIRHELQLIDHSMIEYALSYDLPFIIVLTKADKLNKSEIMKHEAILIQDVFDSFNIEPIMISISSKTGQNIDKLKQIIIDFDEQNE